MTDEINKKVINIFSKHKNDLPLSNEERVKFFAGFDYVKLAKDNNGTGKQSVIFCADNPPHCKS